MGRAPKFETIGDISFKACLILDHCMRQCENDVGGAHPPIRKQCNFVFHQFGAQHALSGVVSAAFEPMICNKKVAMAFKSSVTPTIASTRLML